MIKDTLPHITASVHHINHLTPVDGTSRADLQVIARAARIYFSKAPLIFLESTIQKWLDKKQLPFRIEGAKFTPLTAQVNITWDYKKGPGMSRAITPRYSIKFNLK